MVATTVASEMQACWCMTQRPWTADNHAGSPADDALRRLSERVPELVIEYSEADDDCFLIRMVTNPEPIELQCRTGGQPPFTASDEYSQIDAADSAAAAEAVYELLTA